MKAIILAAGYATRLYPLTRNRPKPLLSIGDTTILDYLIEKLERVENLEEVYIVTNDKFYTNFVEWKEKYRGEVRLTIINDGTTTNSNRLGAIGDLQLVIDKEEIADDLIVLAGDNLFDFELTDFVEYYERVNEDCIPVFELDDLEELQQTGVVVFDKENNVLSFEEKPVQPLSNFAAPPCYIYKQETLPLIKEYLEQGNNPDAPGNFIPWLIQHKQVKAFTFEGKSYDIGTLESYEKIQRKYEKRRSE